MPSDAPPDPDEAAGRFLDVPAEPVHGSRAGRARIAAVAGAAVLIVLAGAANRPARSTSVATTAARGAPSPTGTYPSSVHYFAVNPRLAGTAGQPAVVLDSPIAGPGAPAVTGDRLPVAGVVLVRATRVEIVLMANGNRVFGWASADVADRDGGIRPERSPTFDVSFPLAMPRPKGTLLVVVTAYDASGAPLGTARQIVTVGPAAGRGSG